MDHANPPPLLHLQPPDVTRTAQGIPYSERYGDVYHSSHGGLGQSRHVFLAGNGLPQRWRGRNRFVILETGFGLGLNFLATWADWRADPERSTHLHFVSVEKHPFAPADLEALHAAWPELAGCSQELRAHWPLPVPGFHRLHLDGGRVTLDLLFGDANTLLPALQGEFDAFYLDGFSPARNPELWQETLLHELQRLAAADATLATWSVAAPVRRVLADSGWQLEKKPGYAGKRDMLRGWRAGQSMPAEDNHRRAIVIGAGLAGSSAAERLAVRGWHVTLFDSAPAAGMGASGNRAGVLRPLPALDDNRLARITRAAFLYTRRHLEQLKSENLPLSWGPCGVLHLARDDVHAATQQRVAEAQMPPPELFSFLDCDAACQRAQWPVGAGGWWFPGGAWVDPASLCAANLARWPERIDCQFGVTIAGIAHDGREWTVLADDGSPLASAPHLVLANAADARRLAGDWLPLRAARGQVSHIRETQPGPPDIIVCRLGYVTPHIAGERYAGATFTVRDDDPALRDADHAENLAKLDFILPGFSASIDRSTLGGRVGFRPVSPDRLPMIGALPRLGDDPAADGLWLINGFGARGIVWSALAGELLASRIAGDPLPLDTELAQALAPARFLTRRKTPRPR